MTVNQTLEMKMPHDGVNLFDTAPRQEIAPSRQYNPITLEQSPLFNGDMFKQMLLIADAMSKCESIPQHFRGKPADCLRVVEYSYRIKQSPFQVIECISLIKGKMMQEGKLITAVINCSPFIKGSLNFSITGDIREKKSLHCIVSGTKAGETEPREITVSWSEGFEMSPTKTMWNNMPEQMLCYYGARVWARRYAPEVMLGLYSNDEPIDEPEVYEPQKFPDNRKLETNQKIEEALLHPAEQEKLPPDALVSMISSAPTIGDLESLQAPILAHADNKEVTKMLRFEYAKQKAYINERDKQRLAGGENGTAV